MTFSTDGSSSQKSGRSDSSAGQNPPPEWDCHLDPDERFIWQSAPLSRLFPEIRIYVMLALAVAILVMSAAVMKYTEFGQSFAPAFGLVPLLVAGFLVWTEIIAPFRVRRNSLYMLTNKRALIGIKGTFSTTVTSYPIAPDTTIEFKYTEPPTIFFAAKVIKGDDADKLKPVGFELIDNATHISALMRRIRNYEVNA